ncbi:MAG: sulfurtransferase [Rubrivivax sp.]|nr:MAG: sulfurtransferase [Rubrivivax sp.]
MPSILNISAYQFITLNDPDALRERLWSQADALGLKGTVLIAEEGINLFLAGPAEAVRAWVALLKEDTRFKALSPKESWSDAVPFRKLLVKVKGEIIRMNHPTIRPDARGDEGRAPAVSPATLKRWLDQGADDDGRPVVTLDTRNAFEVDYGSFEGAIDWRIDKFSQFPEQVAAHKNELEGKTVVSFCTGGIRCEKAALFMQEAGIAHVYQLDGGILKYFEDTDGAHWQGECFVFDDREALGCRLEPRVAEAPDPQRAPPRQGPRTIDKP